MTDKLAAVRWRDAHVAQVDSFTKDEIKERQPVVYITFGLIVRHDESLVAIAAEVCEDGTYRGVTYVPTQMVTDITMLGVWPKRCRAKGEDKRVGTGTPRTPQVLRTPEAHGGDARSQGE